MEEQKKGVNPKLIDDEKEIEYRKQQKREEKETIEKYQQSGQTKDKPTIDLSKKREEMNKDASHHTYLDKRHCDKYIKHLKKINHIRLQEISRISSKDFRKLVQEVIDAYNQEPEIVHAELSIEEKLNNACEVVTEKYRVPKPKREPERTRTFTRELTDKNIEDAIVKGVHKLGHVGKNKNIKVTARFCAIRLVVNANPESKNVVLQGPPGTGKDSLLKRMRVLLFPSKWLHYDCASQTSFDHMMAELTEEQRKKMFFCIVYFEDLDEATLNSKHFRTMLSSAVRSVIWTNRDLGTTGVKYPKVTMVMTFGPEVDMNNHTLRRIFGFWIENTEDERKNIVSASLDNVDLIPYYLDDLKKENRNFIEEMIERTENLKLVKVIIPKELKEYIKTKLLPSEFGDDKQITDANRLFDFIKTSTALNQEERTILEEDVSMNFEGFDITYDVIEAKMEDINQGKEMFTFYIKEEQNKEDKKKKQWARKDPKKAVIMKLLKDNPGTPFEYREISRKLEDEYNIRMADATLYKKLDKLVEEGKISKDKETNHLGQDVQVWQYGRPEIIPK